MGVWDSSSEIYATTTHSVIRPFIHNEFNPSNLKNDVAILRISPNANLGAVPSIATVMF